MIHVRDALLAGALMLPLACGDDDLLDDETAGSSTAPGDDASGFPCVEGSVDGEPIGPHDEASCQRGPMDYAPGADDAWPACLPDDGTYPLYADTPSSIQRVVAYTQVVDLLWGTPTPEVFSQARAAYSEAEGLESRVLRREDLHFPEIPMDQWDPGLDGDKQCNNAALAAAHPQRCAGPALIAPIVDAAFVAGQTGQGMPEVHAARIKAALVWFLYLSVYKEANTCLTSVPNDCDSSWAYYTGGFDRAGGIGFSAEVRQRSELAHQAIWDGFSAFRCLRELVPLDDDPSLDDLTADQTALFHAANGQLSDALAYGLALIVRDALVSQREVCEVEAAANWAFIRVLGPVLSEDALRKNAGEVFAPASAAWATDAPPDAAALRAAVAAIDAVFPCPS